MRRILAWSTASIVLWTSPTYAQTPSYLVPGQLPPAAVRKGEPKKRKTNPPPKAPPALQPSPVPATPTPILPVPEGAASDPMPASPRPRTAEPPPDVPPPAVPLPSSSVEPATPTKWLDATSAPPPDGKPLPTFSFRFDPSWGYRRFAESEVSSSDKRFGTPGVFLIGARAEVYPLASVDAGILRDVGMTGAYVRAVGVSLTDFDSGAPIDATWFSYSLALRARVLGRTGPFTVGLSAGFQQISFTFEPAIVPVREVPTGDYSLLEGSVDARQSFGNFSVFLDAGYLYPFQIGSLGDRIPNKRAYGGRGVLGLAFKLSRMVEMDAHASYTFVRFSLQPLALRSDEPGRVFDQYILSTIGLRFSL